MIVIKLFLFCFYTSSYAYTALAATVISHWYPLDLNITGFNQLKGTDNNLSAYTEMT